MAEQPSQLMQKLKENKLFKMAFAVTGIMSTLLVYGVLQEKIMRVPYGPDKEYFKYSLFLVFCNRITTSAVSGGFLLALKYVSFPVQTLAKCAKMIPVMIWGTVIMQKKYTGRDYLFAFFVTLGCSIFILFPVKILEMLDMYLFLQTELAKESFWKWEEAKSWDSFVLHERATEEILMPSLNRYVLCKGDISPYSRGRESTVWGVSLMLGYLGFDGFTSTFQDKLFKGYDMGIHNQIFYTTLCSCMISFTGLLLQGNLPMAIDFVTRHNDCFFDIIILSTVATVSQFFISYTIRNFGALAFATIMTTRQLVSILLSCVWFAHPLSAEQLIGAVIVFGTLYSKSFLKSKPGPLSSEQTENEASAPARANT
ncbi:UNVERIFIED_CONTAM: UDP-galactose/UDP-glucose transporter 5 [Sesamum calycinum]|uniref:UDP-galactose/UDP-glucose transporter 5 n=1 Tax=Sesamum calycinum TaxID=2727403 RepID=A0AAW2SDQ0_9LAMI